MDLLIPNEISAFFNDKNYTNITPYKIDEIPEDNKTIFITAGIQPSIDTYKKMNTDEKTTTFISQPVLRTQYLDSIEEGSSIAFVNPTTAGFNINKKDYESMIKDWYNFFNQIGLNTENISTQDRECNTVWGDLSLKGISTFYYYNKTNVGNVEIGDSTYFDEIYSTSGNHLKIKTLSDLGFGLERLRWCTFEDEKSYFDIYSDSRNIDSRKKGLISALSVLGINNVQPSQKNQGYRARHFSKKLVNEKDGNDLNIEEQKYLVECLKYWSDWENIDLTKEKAQKAYSIIKKEFDRNCNSLLISKLNPEQKELVKRVNVNLPREDFIKRLASAKINIEQER